MIFARVGRVSLGLWLASMVSCGGSPTPSKPMESAGGNGLPTPLLAMAVPQQETGSAGHAAATAASAALANMGPGSGGTGSGNEYTRLSASVRAEDLSGRPPSSPSTAESLVAWMKSVVPARGVVDLDAKGSPRVIHHGEKGETSLAIAANYLDLTSIYSKVDLAAALDKQMPELRGGLREPKDIAIPHLVTVVPKLGDEARLGWPADKALRGIFLTTDGGPKFPKILQSLADRDMNAIVLDGKDYEGYFAYPSGVPLAKDTHANQRASVRSLARAVRFAHERGVRIIMRNSCFHDPWLAKQRPDLSVKSRTGKPYPLQWVDPSNEKVQEFILAVIGEQLDAGVDEIQLDYIRYPVRGIEGADFRLSERGLTQGKVIAEFVKKVHTLTKSRNVPLSLDVFGVAAWNRPEDVVPLGQDLRVLGAESEALSPMVYPSHFAPGFQGLAEPGAHPEVIGLGTRATLNVLASANVKTVVRPWLQAFPWKSPGYGSKYIADEIRSAEQSGATGWLLWHPGGDYGVAWKAIPPKHRMASL